MIAILKQKCCIPNASPDAPNIDQQLAKLTNDRLSKLIELTSCNGKPVWGIYDQTGENLENYCLPRTDEEGRLIIMSERTGEPPYTPYIKWDNELRVSGTHCSDSVTLEEGASMGSGSTVKFDFDTRVKLEDVTKDEHLKDIVFSYHKNVL
jgi:hypothetical protein